VESSTSQRINRVFEVIRTLQTFRNENGAKLSLKELSQLLGIPDSTIHQLLNTDQVHTPRKETIDRILEGASRHLEYFSENPDLRVFIELEARQSSLKNLRKKEGLFDQWIEARIRELDSQIERIAGNGHNHETTKHVFEAATIAAAATIGSVFLAPVAGALASTLLAAVTGYMIGPSRRPKDLATLAEKIDTLDKEYRERIEAYFNKLNEKVRMLGELVAESKHEHESLREFLAESLDRLGTIDHDKRERILQTVSRVPHMETLVGIPDQVELSQFLSFASKTVLDWRPSKEELENGLHLSIPKVSGP